MFSNHISIPNQAKTQFPFPEEISVSSVHRNRFLCDLTLRILSAYLYDKDPIKRLASPFTKFRENIRGTITNWKDDTFAQTISSIYTLKTIAMLAAFFFPNLRNHLMTSRTLSIISITSSALIISKRVSFLIKSEVNIWEETCLCSDSPKNNQKNLKNQAVSTLITTVITATFFALAFKTPIRTAFDRIAYCTQSTLTNWKITNWETLAESIQGFSTLITATSMIQLHYGDKKVTRLTREVIFLSAPPCLVALKPFHFI